MVTLPALGLSAPAMSCSSVVLPEPLAPRMATRRPRGIERSTQRRIWRLPYENASARVSTTVSVTAMRGLSHRARGHRPADVVEGATVEVRRRCRRRRRRDGGLRGGGDAPFEDVGAIARVARGARVDGDERRAARGEAHVVAEEERAADGGRGREIER